MKHTKGKWKLLILPNSRIRILEQYRTEYIASIPTGYAIKKSYEESIANAKLISKAPEMYEALKIAVHMFNTYHKENSTDGLIEHYKNVESLLKEIES